MNRRDLVLAILTCSDGRPYTPAQLQKAVFLACRNMPELVTEGPTFAFVAYDYGPFDPAVYAAADDLAREGLAVITPSNAGRWNTYSASDEGLADGRDLLRQQMDVRARDYLHRISEWVRAQTFSSLVRSIYEAYPEMRENSIFLGVKP